MAGPVIDDSRSPVLRVVGFLLIVGVIGAAVAGGVFLLSATGGDDSDGGGERAEEEAESTIAPASTVPPPPPTTVPPPVDLLRTDPRPAVDAWLAEVGRATRALRISLYPDYGFLEAQDPDRPDRVLRYPWRGGVVEGPEDSPAFPATSLGAELFLVRQPDWDRLPRLVARAPQRAGIPRGEVTHVIVSSDQPFSNRFLFRIYVTGPDALSAFVEAPIT
jgi:hypothetical protein